ncbi:MAG: ATP-binding protein [Pseudomonadota bacterium]|nr:ATP-binding protein [Pseudomonadota bacterium]
MDQPTDRAYIRLKRTVSLGAAAAVLILGWQVWDAWSDYIWSGEMRSSVARVEKAREEVIRLHEILNTSPRMAVGSGVPEWEARYREVEPRLEKLIADVVQLQPDAPLRAALAAMQQRSRDFLQQDREAEAQGLLTGGAHEAQRKAYAEGMTEVNQNLLRVGDSMNQEVLHDLYWDGTIAAACTLLLVLGSWLVFRAMRDWQVIVDDNNRQMKHKSAELDLKVGERTQELNDSALASLNMMEDAVLQREKSAQAYVALENAHQQLVEASRQAGMAEVATNVLHNVGNVLNSVNVSATLVIDSIKSSRAGSLGQIVGMLREHAADLGSYITTDPKGRHVPAFLEQLSREWIVQQQSVIGELESLRSNLDHIKQIVAMQQRFATVSGVTEVVDVTDLVEDSLRINEGALIRHRIKVIREFEAVPPISVEKHKVLQVLVNLVRNAKNACDESGVADRQMTLAVRNGAAGIRISVSDNGVGIAPENLTRIFVHGFTTRKDGHGFGLHSGALAAAELGGSLSAYSDGPGKGATFTLELPRTGAGP